METPVMIQKRFLTTINISRIVPNPAQPRKNFDPEGIASLAESIRRDGLLSPVLVRRIGLEKYELIAGERRLRAVKILGRMQIEAIVVAAFDCDSAVLALIENLQRKDISYLEEARACREILDIHGMTQDELARRLGKSPSTLANRLRLLNLSPAVLEFLAKNPLSERHARALLSIPDPDMQLNLAREALARRMTVKQLEERIEKLKKAAPRRIKNAVRDARLYINAVSKIASHLREMGALVAQEEEHTDFGLVITLKITVQGENTT